MIANRVDRQGLPAAKPVLVVGAAPSRSGGDLSESPAGTGTGFRLARYAGVSEQHLSVLFDFVNLLPEWPGEAEGASSRWDGFPNKTSWEVGQRASLLLADVHERPRHLIVGLGGWVRDCLRYWWSLSAPLDPASGWLFWHIGPARSTVAWSPHPAGTSMWWNENRAAGEEFWRNVARRAESLHSRAPAKVRMSVRTQWMLNVIASMDSAWPQSLCVDWPWVDPPGRPQMYLHGQGVPAAHGVLEAVEGPRPSPAHQALHSCDRGEHCVSGAHLRWGLEIENRLDQSTRGRGDIGLIGLDKAREVRKELEELAARHGVPLDAVARIAGGKTWTDDKWETN